MAAGSKSARPAKAVLGKSAILSADDRPVERLPVPEWGGDILLRKWSAAAQLRFEDFADGEGEASKQAMAFALVLSAVDEAGAPVFEDADVAQIMDKGLAPLVRAFRKISAMNKLGEAELKDAAGN